MNPYPVLPAVARGPAGSAAVAAGSGAAAEAATGILRAGGNAVDAALGGMLASCVSEPVFASLGGGGFLLVRQPDGTAVLVDFFANTPGLPGPSGSDRPDADADGAGATARDSSAAEPEFTPITVRFPGTHQVFHAGPGAVAVPGMLAGVLHASDRYGRLGLARIVAPAIRIGREGAVLEPAQATVLALVREIMSLTPQCRDLITVDGRFAAVGELVHNPDLADFLSLLADGSVTGMSDPGFAGPMLDLMAHTSGHVTAADLARYEVIDREPLTIGRGAARILFNPPPAFGGAIVADSLSRLGTVDAGPDSWRSAVHALMAATEHHRTHLRDESRGQVTTGTTHISVVDFEGQIASFTVSNGAGSGVVVPGTGIHLNNMLGEEDLNPGGFHSLDPGLRMSSMMAPTIVECADGSITGLGSGGSERIRSAVLNTVLRLTDLHEPVDRAIAAPRFHPDANGVQLEPGWDPELVALLQPDHPVNIWSAPDLFFGGVHAVSRMPDGSVLAVGDDRRGGVARVLRP